MTHALVKKLVLLSSIATLVAIAMMVLSIAWPKPLNLVLAMSLGQGIGTLSLALYLLAIVLDLQGGSAAVQDQVVESRAEASADTSREDGPPVTK